jgi:predicted PurR-regulated permease PerM
MVSVMSILFIFQVPYAFLLGFMAGIFNFIPYLGSLIAVSFISVIALITCKFNVAVPVIIALLIFQQLDANFIEPRIMKTSLKISPILVIVSVIAGGAYFGPAGMFLAVPLVCVVKQIVLEYIDHAEEKGEIKDKDKDD